MAKTLTNTELDTVISYMTLCISYDYNIVLPYKDGIALLAALEKAESIERHYTGDKIVFNDAKREIEIRSISQAMYREQKMLKLLGVQDNEPTA